jgi:hypothetical protein
VRRWRGTHVVGLAEGVAEEEVGRAGAGQGVDESHCERECARARESACAGSSEKKLVEERRLNMTRLLLLGTLPPALATL